MLKPNGRIRIYIDFKEINKVYPKNNFYVPNIYTLVENTMGHKMFSLMDEFFGYNQIMIVKEYKHKIIFTTP